jgi:chromosome segregation protein
LRLKSLEIKGFKSFADKTVVHFDQGITGIIGPNGCGKSNIVDSIRWVIGEHKISNLRSENLESLVFNGSKTRSASGLAEVSLTFENTRNLLPTEFSTVTVTRKFYKNGESEYRLNDVQCRLKDIHNLFLDTGVSSDSYAIIELGMVDDIIRDKDNSRRRMLEQAAGISIYKTRKKEARLKLDATEQDLARIEDLVFEINNQLKMLEGQARKAERYLEVRKEYRSTSVEFAKAALEGFNSSYEGLVAEQDADTDRKHRLEAEIATQDAALEQERLEFIQRERELQSLQAAFNELLNNIRTRESERNLTAQRLQYLSEREGQLREYLEKAERQLDGIEESIRFTEVQVEEESLRTTVQSEQVDKARLDMEEKRRSFDGNRATVDNMRRENQALQRQQFDAEKQVAVGDASLQNMQRSVLQLTQEQEQRRRQIAEVTEEKGRMETELGQTRTELVHLQEEHERTKGLILETQAVLEGLRSQLAEEGRRLDARLNEHSLLKSLIDSMEGYPESVKFLHKNPDWNHRAPILSDIIYVKEEYRTALENVLDPYLNYYVVNDLAEGMRAVQLLDANQKGKANFFLLEKLVELPADPAAADIPGTIHALDVVEYEPMYGNLVRYLLGKVLITDGEPSVDMAAGHVILDRKGRFVVGRYSLTGGSVGLFEGKKIGRVKNLEKLAEEITGLEEKVAALKASVQARHDEVIGYNRQLDEQAIRRKQEQVSNLVNRSYALQNKLESLQQSEAIASHRLEELTNLMRDGQEDVSDARDRLEGLNEQMSLVLERMQQVEADYSAAERDYNESVAVHNECNLQLTRQQARLNALRQELEFKRNQVSELNRQMASSRTQLEEAAVQISESRDALSGLEAAMFEYLGRKEAEERSLNEADQAYYNLRNVIAEKESGIRQKSKEKEQLDEHLNLIKDRINDIRLRLAGIRERLSVEFRIDIEQIWNEPRQTTDTPEELQAACERMKKRLENMGEVNTTAIEAYTEMKARFDFIVEQKNDLTSAKDNLVQTIMQVEATANQRFHDTFQRVRENFQMVFKALFTEEDTADMILEDPSNLAETGIDIVAKPKGKRPTSITQLSGGEKTLTATALLFAIYLIKPAPFCILDEVDAPLDDVNVAKFTGMIRQFSKDSQFIIVTHNKSTMSAVDIIYGVTMQEAGVSKLVAVDFRSIQQEKAMAAG